MRRKMGGFARNAARRWGGAALRRVNNRRRGRGRRVYFPADRVIPRMQRLVQGVAPLRNNTSTSEVARDEIVNCTEKTNITLLSLMGDTHEAGYVSVSALESQLWPMLAEKARMYDKYEIKGMDLIYEPSVGTGYNGNLAMCFVSNAQHEGGDFNNSQMVLGAKPSINVPVSVRTVFPIPTRDMSLGGGPLNMPRSDVTVQDVTTYYAGALMYLPYNCTDNAQVIGTLSVRYTVVLKKQRLDASPTMSLITQTVQHAGDCAVRVIDDDPHHFEFTYTSIREANLILMVHSGTGTCTILLNGVDISSDPHSHYATFGGGPSAVISFHPLGRHLGRNTVEITTTQAILGASVVASHTGWFGEL